VEAAFERDEARALGMSELALALASV